ncbi:hypothetical protein CEXT_364671 [Caerostris extrusa]|uniref:Uncharacterized protein n=1 Tax=Caerostris extrusa TaxID=172846 RepID=A0AAV4VD22_CAEEX|nr:hypothetical protein CEXT_364671 [Caerostris extrusa]
MGGPDMRFRPSRSSGVVWAPLEPSFDVCFSVSSTASDEVARQHQQMVSALSTITKHPGAPVPQPKGPPLIQISHQSRCEEESTRPPMDSPSCKTEFTFLQIAVISVRVEARRDLQRSTHAGVIYSWASSHARLPPQI